MARPRPRLRLARALRRFRRGQGGYMLVEAVLIIPFLVWGYVALYSYWDAYRTMTDLQKVTYAMSDLISREQRTINAAYVTGLRNTMSTMLGSDQTPRVRVTSIMWSEIQDRFVVEWSNSPSGMAQLTTAGVNAASMRSSIPDMGDGKTAIIFEALLDFEPALSLGFADLPGLQPMTFEEFVVTPPRYAPRIVFR
ncbi:MAG: hypothetical protein KF887_15970 [Paracoccaceae bacterium]|nr:MAG: hypothetical protein KF887_15970 [Paracoccaceae bacterium]